MQLTKDLAVYPERRQPRLRKWLTYLTLVISSSIITGDLITMLAKLLDGDLTIPFILKVLTILQSPDYSADYRFHIRILPVGPAAI